MQRNNKNLQFQATVQPMSEFRIQLTANRTNSTTVQYYYLADSSGVFGKYTQQQLGSYSITTIAIPTLFEAKGKNNASANFAHFKSYRQIMAQRLADNRASQQSGYNKGSDAYPDGYGSLSQDVLLYSFLAAYLGKPTNEVDISTPFFNIPLPNWNVTYTGLSKIPGIKDFFQNITLSHAYVCT